MCGIFASYGISNKKQILHYLKKITQRGKDTFGISLINSNPKNFYSSYNNLNLKRIVSDNEINDKTLIIANSRLITNGSNSKNTQPIVNEGNCLVHNGIIIDLSDFNANSLELDQDVFSDTRKLLNKLIEFQKISEGEKKLEDYLNSLTGEINIVLYNSDNKKLYYYTNNGSLYIKEDSQNFLILSEKEFFLKKDFTNVKQVKKNILNFKFFETNLKLSDQKNYTKIINYFKNKNKINSDLFDQVTNKIKKKITNIERCTKCLIPRTYPKIRFDKDGVCEFCNNFKIVKRNKKSIGELKDIISKKGKRCLVGLSGGFDSCYALYYIKEILGLDPIAFTYDWGLTTDIARVNQSIMCEKLKVEHIIRTDNMVKKRSYIKKNINAWFKKPHPGLIPLFMAGDKKFLHYEHKLKKELNIEYSFFGTGSGGENRPFYYMYANTSLKKSFDHGKMSSMKLDTKLKLMLFYGINFIKNPSLINSSLLNSAMAYYYSFFENYNYISLFQYLDISNEEKNKFLIDNFDLKTDHKYGKEIWRMGDGQSSFNNLLFASMCGFTEIDDQISNSIRNKEISRNDAFERIISHNLPKEDMLQYFFDLISIDSNKTLEKVLLLKSF